MRLRDRTSTVAVLDPAGHLLGYITLQNLTEKMMIAEAPGAH